MVCNNNQNKPTKNFITQSFMLGTDKYYQIYRSVSAPFFYLFMPVPVAIFVRESSVYIYIYLTLTMMQTGGDVLI